ncbi:hypothetical protein NC651_031513 [Populus alba x Populus x berolinensis]|nr:hypothetical protein NC651_031513 [Populus alba x Populus x berolinensis]
MNQKEVDGIHFNYKKRKVEKKREREREKLREKMVNHIMACCINLFIGSISLEISCTHHDALVLPLQKTYSYKEKERRSVQNYKGATIFIAADLLCFDAGSRFISFDFLAHRGMLCQVELIDRTLLFVKFIQQGWLLRGSYIEERLA